MLCYVFISCVYILYIGCELQVSQAKCALVQERNSSLFGHSRSCPIYPPPAQLHPPLRTPRPFNMGHVEWSTLQLTWMWKKTTSADHFPKPLVFHLYVS